MYQYKIKLDRVIDGDTIDCMIDLGFDISTKKRIRFLGINTPESRTRDLEEKKRGLEAKARLKEILEGANEIHLDSHGVGKYGRVLGEIFIESADGTRLCINEQLKIEGHAYAYHGGKKQLFKG